MKRLIMYLLGILTMVLMCAALFLSGAIYDAWNKSQTETYFFQGNNLSSDRPGKPISPNDLGESTMQDMLIKKFITEYFYVWPDGANVQKRAQKYGALYWLASPNVLSKWVEEMAPEIQQMSNKNIFRTVSVRSILKPRNSDYWSVEYELKTWMTSNNPDTVPEIERGRMLIQIAYRPGIMESIVDYGIHRLLDEGGDPVMLFQFRVMDINQE